ncbi:MAG: putative quinol monooxygenase [Pseudomonadota bacterium]
MIIVTGTVRLPEGALDTLLPAANAMMKASRAEDGCLHYVYAQDLNDPCLIHVSERWQDQASLDAHFQTNHMKIWRQALAAVKFESRDLLAFEAGEGTPT